MVASRKTLTLGPFTPGVDNRRDEIKMRGDRRSDGGDFLRFAVNADISAQGTVKRRAGYTSVLAGSDQHSLWADGADAFVVEGADLMRLTGLPDAPALTSVLSGLTPGRPMSYSRAPSAVFFSNGAQIGRLTAAGAAPIGTPSLAVTPMLSLIGGSLPQGRYGVCFTQRDAAGEESPTTHPTWIEVGPNQGLRAANLPAAFAPGVAAVVVYMTLPNDSTFQRAALLLAPFASVDFTVMPALGARCPTMQLQHLPAGDIVRHLSARTLVAVGKTLFYSEPYMLGLFNPTRGYIQFPGVITVVEPTSGGLWVCADQTYWFAGLDIAAASPDAKAAYGGVPGSGGQVPNSNDVFWMSPRGVMRGTQTGELTNLQEARVATAASGFAAGVFREYDGRKQYVESTFAPEQNRMAATSYMDAEIVRKGVLL